jgi:hypothetical protein
LSSLFIFACKQDPGIVIPAEKPSLVVNSRLCADSLISFNLSYTQSITNNSAPEIVSNAIIELFDKDTVSIETLSNLGNGVYLSTTVAQASKYYIVKIMLPAQTYWSGDSVPVKVDGKITSTDSINFRNNPFFYQIHFSLNDKQKYQNFYSFKLKHYFEEYLLNDTLLKEEWLDIETIDPILTEDLNSRFSKRHLLFTDRYFNNTNIQLSFGTPKIANNSLTKTKKLILYTEQFTNHSYSYFSSMNEHIFYQNDPFSQPILVKGNINNAMGAFAGENIKADTINFNF